MTFTSFLNRMERKYGQMAISNLTLFIIAGQAVLYFLAASGQFELARIVLIPEKILNGEIWRLFSFIFIPPFQSPFFAVIYWYMFWLFGSGLEENWGVFKFNVFLINGYLFTILFSFFNPYWIVTNVYVPASLVIAYALIYPDFEILLFFILPVKIKWVGIFTAVSMALAFFLGTPAEKPMILAVVINIVLFFHEEWWSDWKAYRRRNSFHSRQ